MRSKKHKHVLCVNNVFTTLSENRAGEELFCPTVFSLGGGGQYPRPVLCSQSIVEKPYEYNVDKKRFSRTGNLALHMRTHFATAEKL